MVFFAKKSSGELKKDIARYERLNKSEEARERLKLERRALQKKYLATKYKKAYAFASKAGVVGAKLGDKGSKIVYSGSVSAYRNLEREKFSPRFKADFAYGGAMVNLPNTGSTKKKSRSGYGGVGLL